MHSIDFEGLFERLPSPHVVLDRDLVFVAVNAAYEHVVMRGRDELLGNRLFDMFPNEGEAGKRLKASFERVLASGESDTLAYISYDIPRPADRGGGIEQRYWTAVHTPLRDGDGNVSHILQNTVDVTEMVRLREAASLPYRAYSAEVQLIERAREAEDARHMLLAESVEFRRMFQQAPGFIAILSGPEHVFTFANDAYRRLVGGRDVVGKSVTDALPELQGQGFHELLERVYRTGDQHLGEGTRVMLRRDADESPRETFLDFSYDAIRNLEGEIAGVFVQGMDRTEGVKTLRRQRLLLDELNHRVKNTLATVQSIASQTLRTAVDLSSAKKAFEARIMALSKAHNILSARQWTDAELGTIVDQELSAHGARRIERHGPEVQLNPKASIALAMLVHELATNAAKFGALSKPSGKVAVSWHQDEGGVLSMNWKESGSAPITPPSRVGFGSRMIERVVIGELSGEYGSDYAPDGFSCEFKIPLSAYGQFNDAFSQ